MHKNARQLPLQHISIRVPWHDNKWNGKVCKNPMGNSSCLVLSRIGEKRDDIFEMEQAGKEWGNDGVKLPACAAERGAFMSDRSYSRFVNHPYHKDWGDDAKLYSHFATTEYEHPPFTAAAVPYGWMMKEKDGKTTPEHAARLDLDFDYEEEPSLSFSTGWVQQRDNQLMMLDTFFGAIRDDESIVLFYAKDTPLSDDHRRVIVGLGKARRVEPHVEYSYEGNTDGKLRCVLWERNIHHSIRPGGNDGFLLPYGELLSLAETDPELDLNELLLFAPEEKWSEFSMGSEHVSHDSVISILIACASLIKKYDDIGIMFPSEKAKTWIDAELNRLWKLRGAYPGLGSALTAFGLQQGTLIAHEVGRLLHSDGSETLKDPWPLVENVFENPGVLGSGLSKYIGPTNQSLWKALTDEEKSLLKLLARFDLSSDQAKRWYNASYRKDRGVDYIGEVLENPYILFEKDCDELDPISVFTIDHGIFADNAILKIAPFPDRVAINEYHDDRRVRALTKYVLTTAAQDFGHTVLPQSTLINNLIDLPIQPICEISDIWFREYSDQLQPEIISDLTTKTGEQAFQLSLYEKYRKVISKEVKRRTSPSAKGNEGDHNWREYIDQPLPDLDQFSDSEKNQEIDAREEKSAALEVLYRSNFSVLVGPAGTGKTSLLESFLNIPGVAGATLLLAPTGKASVQMQRRLSKETAQTVASFLNRLERYDGSTGRYHFGPRDLREGGFANVIIDESSMLTEDQLASILDALRLKKILRLILVGDPNQLPPIGAGRPFADIVRYLNPKNYDDSEHVPSGLAVLRNVRRQTSATSQNRDDLVLSRWFSGDEISASDDYVWNEIIAGTAKGVKAIKWVTPNDLKDMLEDELNSLSKKEMKLEDDCTITDSQAFAMSLGGSFFQNDIYFRCSKSLSDDATKTGGQAVENWQILSPMRGTEVGVSGLNRWIKEKYRQDTLKWANFSKSQPRRICKPLGAENIVYGDKVINTRNHRRTKYVKPNKEDGYIANGEIGLVVGTYSRKKSPQHLNVEFSSQPHATYGFHKKEFGGDRDVDLELAYALTVHKSQGSEFGKVFVIIPEHSRLMSSELLYTAFTRQKDEIVILHQGELRDLVKYSDPSYSATKKRMTNLFHTPNPVAGYQNFLEAGLIHKTKRGHFVRSKSELIIADKLHDLGVDYEYEMPLQGTDGSIRYPDFTVEDVVDGTFIVIEHLGLLSQENYRRKWDVKLQWYRDNGILMPEEGDGTRGVLITTNEVSGINSAELDAKLSEVFDN